MTLRRGCGANIWPGATWTQANDGSRGRTVIADAIHGDSLRPSFRFFPRTFFAAEYPSYGLIVREATADASTAQILAGNAGNAPVPIYITMDTFPIHERFDPFL